MIQAAEKDRASNDQKRPATAKLAMLEEVMGILRKYVHGPDLLLTLVLRFGRVLLITVCWRRSGIGSNPFHRRALFQPSVFRRLSLRSCPRFATITEHCLTS